jgi:hypothetical protein
MLQGNKLITPNFRGMFEWCNEKTNNNHKKNQNRVVEGVISPFDLQKEGVHYKCYKNSAHNTIPKKFSTNMAVKLVDKLNEMIGVS